MSYHKRLTEEQKAEVRRLHSEHCCNKDIASEVGSNKAQIQQFIYRENKNSGLPPKPIIRHHLVEGALALALNAEADEHPRMGRNRLRQKLIEDHPEFSEVPSARNISRYLQSHAFNHKKMVKNPLFIPENVRCRLEFTSEYVGKDLDF
jgi:IS30 family transposase